jgi:hypothetical protein
MQIEINALKLKETEFDSTKRKQKKRISLDIDKGELKPDSTNKAVVTR